MTYRFIHLIFTLTFISSFGYTQAILDFPLGTTPTIDGQISSGEWDDAEVVEIDIINGLRQISVKVKHDGEALFFAFCGFLESTNSRFPEILIDARADRTDQWDDNDWWFHVSATDCDNRGTYGIYDQCAIEKPGWTGGPNFNPGPPLTDTVEIAIPFSYLEWDSRPNDTFGISLLVTNTFSFWEHWPQAANRSTPSTWGIGVLKNVSNTTPKQSKRKTVFHLTGNPSRVGTDVVLTGDNVSREDLLQIELFDLSGRRLFQWHATGHQISQGLPLNGAFPPGVYIVRVRNTSGYSFIKWIVQ